MINVVEWLLLFLSVLLGLKLAEMFTRLFAALTGKQYARELISACSKWEKSGFNKEELDELRRKHGRSAYRRDWPITKYFLHIRPPIGEFIASLFRYRWLMAVQVLAVVISTNRAVLSVGVFILLAGVWVGIINLLVDRIVFGYVDSYFRKTYANLSADIGNPIDEISQTRQERVQDFVSAFCGMVTILITAYAAIYDGLDKLAGNDGAFQNIPRDWTRPFHLLYFSIVTVATVGYGDVFPKLNSLVARLATASEILAGFMLLIVLVTSVSLTFESE